MRSPVSSASSSLVAAIERGLDLVGFLADFVQHRARVVPVEADGGGLALQVHRARQRGLPGLDAGEQRFVRRLSSGGRRAARSAFSSALMRSQSSLTWPEVMIAVLVGEHMRMAPDHFSRDGLDHVAEGKGVLLLGHAGVKHHLQQEVAELVA